MKRSLIFVACLVVSVSGAMLSEPASASSIMTDWTNAQDIQHEYLQNQNPDKCIKGIWSIETDPGQFYPTPSESAPHEMCVYHQKDFVYAYFSRSYGTQPVIYTESGMAVAKGENIAKGILTPLTSGPIGTFFNPHSPNLMYMSAPSTGSAGFNIHTVLNFASTLEYDSHYRVYRYSMLSETLQDGGLDMRVYGKALSANGAWLAVVTGSQLIRVNQSTGNQDIIATSNFAPSWVAAPGASVAISNDGSSIALYGNTHTNFTIIKTNPSCLNASTYSQSFVTKCKYIGLGSLVDQYSSPITPWAGGLRGYGNMTFSEDSSAITYMTNDMNGINWHRISYKPQPILQYLALGDSFASGEGELFDGNYLPGTNVFGNYQKNIPREMCHLSNRSYPMLLGASMQLSYGNDMRSVACSGAVTNDVLSSDTKPYLGSGTNTPWGWKPRLTSITNATELQEKARNDFTPGRVRQIEFVQKVKPAVATVMIGGNDFNFGGILNDCVQHAFFVPGLTENHGKDCININGESGAAKAQQILDSYPQLVAFYRALQAASPDTKIFVVGYPQFFDATNKQCGNDIILGNITIQDRQTIRSMTSLANATIKNAALDAGLKYLNIEDALGDTILCGDSSSVTGVEDEVVKGIMTANMKNDGNSVELAKDLSTKGLLDIKGKSRAYLDYFLNYVNQAREDVGTYVTDGVGVLGSVTQELSHPNAKGHQLMFDQLSRGLGVEGLYSIDCNEVVVCPDGSVHGAPSIKDFSGLTLPDDPGVIRQDLGHKVTVSYLNAKGLKTYGALEQNGKVTITIDPSDIAMGSAFVMPPIVTIHSTPVQLGSMTIGSDGSYRLEIDKLPSSVTMGIHSLHLTGKLASGSAYDLYQTIFVRGPQGDYDDDGIADAKDTCAFAKPSGVDTDHDGIDDTCQILLDEKHIFHPGYEASGDATPISLSSGLVQRSFEDTRSDDGILSTIIPNLPRGYAREAAPKQAYNGAMMDKKDDLNSIWIVVACTLLGLGVVYRLIFSRLGKSTRGRH